MINRFINFYLHTPHHHHLSFELFVEHRANVKARNSTRFLASHFNSSQLFPFLPASTNMLRLKVRLSLLRCRLPWGFQSKACLALLLSFLRVCPIHLHFLSMICCSTDLCPHLSHSLEFSTLSNHLFQNISEASINKGLEFFFYLSLSFATFWIHNVWPFKSWC